MKLKTKLKIYWNEIRKSWVARSALFFAGLEVIATQSEHVRAIVGEKLFPFVMITVFLIARFRPSVVLPPKDEQ